MDYKVSTVYLVIMSRATSIDYATITSANSIAFIGTSCMYLVNEIMQHINYYYDIDLIISTIPLAKVTTIPNIQIQFYFSEKEQNNL